MHNSIYTNKIVDPSSNISLFINKFHLHLRSKIRKFITREHKPWIVPTIKANKFKNMFNIQDLLIY